MAAKKKNIESVTEHNTDKDLEQIKELLKALVQNSEEVKKILEKLKDRFV